jgi:cytochrome c oxidase subunit 2
MWTAIERVHFEEGRSAIQPRCAQKIAKLAEWLRVDRTVVVALDGHRDDATANDNDPQLAVDRARAVRDALIAAGVAPERIVVGDFGTAPLVCANRENCLALSRRVDVLATRY